jgi:Fe-S-cluster-containing hydrogenase component 2
MNRQLVVKPEKCTGCRTCEIICSYEKTGAFNPELSAVTVIAYDEAALSVPVMCQQCDEAPCVKICPVGALYKDDGGVVAWAENKCIVCRLCADACPMGNMIYSPLTRKMSKCTRCDGDPKCAAFCPSGALSFVPDDAGRSRKRTVAETIKAVYGLEE